MQTIRIDLVSDVACPWCAIGYRRLEHAMAMLEGEVAVELVWQPFELNPGMPSEGEPILEHLCRKYGRDEAGIRQSQDEIVQLAEGLGLDFTRARERRAHSTFDAHRLLAWAGEHGRETELQLALFEAYFGRAENPGDPAVLRAAAEQADLDGDDAAYVIDAGLYADEVRAAKQRFIDAGVDGVPAFILAGRYLVQGAQPPEVLADAIRQVAAEVNEPGTAPAP